jgi:acetyl-CoA carboxylase alpha subunit
VPNDEYVEQLRHKISKRIKKLQKTSLEELLEDRYNKFRKIGL